MPGREVLIVAETPGLARAIGELLGSDHLGCRYVRGLPELTAETPGTPGAPALIIAASDAPDSPTARAWIRGELPDTELIVVGTRDPTIGSAPGIHLLRLPLPPKLFLRFVRALTRAPPEPTWVPVPGARTPGESRDPDPSGAPTRPGPRGPRDTVRSPPGGGAPHSSSPGAPAPVG